MSVNSSKGKQRLLTALILLTLAFIWGNSLLPPEVSWAVSDAVKDLLTVLLPGGGEGTGEGSGTLGVLVRKLAHFTEFCVLGALLAARWRDLPGERTAPLLLGLLAAAADETIQFYTGRTSSVFDVWIDFSGVVVGAVLIVPGIVWAREHFHG